MSLGPICLLQRSAPSPTAKPSFHRTKAIRHQLAWSSWRPWWN